MKQVVILLTAIVVTVVVSWGQEPAGASAGIYSTRLHPALLEFSQTGSPETGGRLARVTADAREMDAIIYTADPGRLARAGIRIQSRYPGFVTALLQPSDVPVIERTPSVRYARPGLRLYPDNDISRVEMGSQLLHAGFINNTAYKGKGAIVLVYDTGIDWKHLDFRSPTDTTKSRILFIWDQTLTAGAGEASPSGFTYGVEYTQAQIQNEIDGTPPGFVREKDINGHGTHVTGTAAGNGVTLGKFAGQAPEADIIFVKGGDQSFSDARMIDGLTYAMNKAAALGKPIVVNWSIGSMWGTHDATDAVSVAVDAFSSTAGRVHVNSAGNSGNSLIHVGGSIAAGGSKSFLITVPTYTRASGLYNDEIGIILWFNSSDNVTAKIQVTTPTAKTFELLAGEKTFADDADGRVWLGNMVSPDNHQRLLYLWVDDADTLKVPKSGIWTVTLSNVGKDVVYDGWLDPVSIGGQTITLDGADANKTVNSHVPQKSILVGSCFTRFNWPTYSSAGSQTGSWTYNYSKGDQMGGISPFSSLGPSRDGRIKPDISAPGQYIFSALSSNASAADSRVHPMRNYQAMQGTSMAAPNVTGCVALLLAQNPAMTADQVKTLLTSTAVTDAYTGTVPNNSFGAGKINVYRALAKRLYPAATTTQTIYRYDLSGMSFINSYTNYVVSVDTAKKYALRFTPSTSGRLAAVLCNLSWKSIPSSAILSCELYTNTTGSLAGIPGTRIGAAVQVPLTNVDHFTTLPIDMLAAGASVTAGTSYHIVLSLVGATGADHVEVFTDDGTANADNRTSVFTGGAWQNSGASGSGLSGKNIRIRPVVVSSSVPLAVGSEFGGTPASFELLQNYPNPFNPSTEISFSIPQSGVVSLKVFEVLGREVTTLVNGEQESGTHIVQWDAKDMASGVYLYTLRSGSYTQTRKMMLIH